MTALTLASIPSNINSYERLFIWAAQCCQSIAAGRQINAVEGAGPQPVAQVQISVVADNTDRFIVSAFVPMSLSALNDPAQKTWMAAQDIATSAPHANLLSN